VPRRPHLGDVPRAGVPARSHAARAAPAVAAPPARPGPRGADLAQPARAALPALPRAPRARARAKTHGHREPGPWIEEAVLLPRLDHALDVDVLHVQLPFHGTRNPRSARFHGEFFWSG